jgi:hypothetical protein
MRCECLACGTKFKNSLAFSDHECERVSPDLPVRSRIDVNLTRRSLEALLRKSNSETKESILA